MKLSKQQVIMHRVRSNIEDVLFAEVMDEPGTGRTVLISTRDSIDMGSPEVITVTIEPGDLLNDEPS